MPKKDWAVIELHFMVHTSHDMFHHTETLIDFLNSKAGTRTIPYPKDYVDYKSSSWDLRETGTLYQENEVHPFIDAKYADYFDNNMSCITICRLRTKDKSIPIMLKLKHIQNGICRLTEEKYLKEKEKQNG